MECLGLPKKVVTPDVMKALKSSFERGYRFCQMDINKEILDPIINIEVSPRIEE